MTSCVQVLLLGGNASITGYAAQGSLYTGSGYWAPVPDLAAALADMSVSSLYPCSGRFLRHVLDLAVGQVAAAKFELGVAGFDIMCLAEWWGQVAEAAFELDVAEFDTMCLVWQWGQVAAAS